MNRKCKARFQKVGSLVLCLSFILIMSLMTSAFASTTLPNDIYAAAQGSSTCTLASAAMMMRARAFLSGYTNYGSITESAIKSTAWITNVGLRWSFTYSFSNNSITIGHTDLCIYDSDGNVTGTKGISLSTIKSLLNSHPEGIELYCGFIPHAVFVTDYDGDTLYCADPYGGNYSGKRLSLASSSLSKNYNSQASILANTTAYWYVSSYNITPTNGTLDVNGSLDGVVRGDLGSFGTFDITIAGETKANQTDFFKSYTSAQNYTISNIQTKTGYDYIGDKQTITGSVPLGSTTKVVLSFATQGNLHVQGNLDGVVDDSIADYGSFDVYIDGSLRTSNQTSYNEKLPKGTTYEIRNIQSSAGKNYDGLTSFTGTITSNTESKVILPFTTDGTATPEWQTGKVVPGNLERETLDVEYKHHYETVATSSPSSDWVQAGVNRTYYQNSGSVQEFPYERSTSDTYIYVGGYYYHWCGSNHDCNYQKTSGKYETYHGPNGLDMFDVVSSGTDTYNSNVKWYKLNWKSGQVYSGAATCATGQTNAWYRMYQYQSRALITEYKWTKDTDWTSTYDSSATSYTVRWRLKDGISTEYKGLQLNFKVDGNSVASLDGIATIDVYINGEQKASNATSFRSFYPGEFSYEISVNNVVVDKIYKQTEGGELTGNVTEDLKILTLCFETGVVSEPDWKIIPGNVLPYVDEHSEIEYKHHYETVGTTSPGDGWVQAGINRTYYENTGSVQEFPYEQTTSDTFVYVGGYYYHWCGSNHDCNYQKTSGKYETYHGPNGLDMFDVVSSGTDTNNSNVKWYKLNWKSGQVYSGAATCATGQTNAWYRMYQYQPRVKITEYKWTKDTDWTNELDTTATSVKCRIRLKQYALIFEAGEGEFDTEGLIKYSGIDLTLPTDVPTRELYTFVAWNTEADGTGAAYLPGAVFADNQDTVLYARWKEVAALNLPNDLITIEEEAFSAVNALIIRVPSNCTTIKSRAFANNTKLQRIYVPSTATSIALDAFDGCPNLTIYAPAGSIAIGVAKYNDIPYVEE